MCILDNVLRLKTGRVHRSQELNPAYYLTLTLLQAVIVRSLTFINIIRNFTQRYLGNEQKLVRRPIHLDLEDIQ